MTPRTPSRMLWSTQMYRCAPTLPWWRNSLEQLLLRCPWWMALSRGPLPVAHRMGGGLALGMSLLLGVGVGGLRVRHRALLRSCSLTEVTNSLLLTFLAPIPSSFTTTEARRHGPLSLRIYGRCLSLVGMYLLGRRQSGICLRVSLRGCVGILRRWVGGRIVLVVLLWSLYFYIGCKVCLLFRCLLLLRRGIVSPPLFALLLRGRCGILW